MPPSQTQNQSSNLRIPNAPNFPFSSPIMEEIPSPTSSSEERETERMRLFALPSKGTGRNPFGDTNDAQRRNENSRTIKKGAEKPVGLNLVTDFSSSKRDNTAPAPTFVDLNDLKMLSKERERERSTQKIRDILKKRNFQGFQRLADDLAEQGNSHGYLDPNYRERTSPEGKGKDEVSPSDRPIMIGYTVPLDEVSSHKEDKPKELDSAGSHVTPLTPSIVVTPAKEEGFWSGSAAAQEHPRPRSSVYSQPTPNIGYTQSDIPPVPAIPALHSVTKNENARKSIFARRNRALSTGTVFEEDASPRLARRSRAYSDDNGTATQRQSVNSFVNKHQSQGWWTYLLSPILGRPDTPSSRKTPTSADRPPLPSAASASSSATEWWEKDVSCFSPDTPATAAATSRGIVDFRDGPDEKGSEGHHPGRGVVSFMFPGGRVQGAAAEYYQACAHELFSGRPYFECINHVCSITPRDKISVRESGAAEQPADGSRGLALVDVDAPSETNPFVDPSNPHGHYSGSTAIGDGPDNPFEADKSIKDPNQYPESPEASPPRAREIPETSQPTPFYPDDKGTSSHVEQKQTAMAPPAPSIYFPPSQSPPRPSIAPERAAEPEPHRMTVFPGHPQIESPDAPSPGFQREAERGGGGSIPLSEVHESPAPAYGSNDSFPILPSRSDPYPMSRQDMEHPYAERDRIETQRRRLEREDEIGRAAGGLWRGRGPVSKKGCFGRPGREGRLRRRWYVAIAAFFLTIIIVAIVLATTLTRKGDETPLQSRWLNLTGYPPMPTGVATIAGPQPQEQNSGCIKPASLWSCALPKAQHAANKPYAANEPNFRVAIRFRNGTYDNSTVPVSNSTKLRRDDDSSLFKPSPSPPSIQDQTFLGNTTDNNTEPYAGEETPFYISFLSPIKLSSSNLTKRSSSFPNLTSLIPSSDEDHDGTAAPANLYPLPESQPVQLYNRGRDSEHYGFYTYFDRSIFLASSAPLGGTRQDQNADDQTGESSKENARVRCTWAQTRFLVQIWTRPSRAGMALVGNASSNASQTSTATSSTPTSTPSSSPSSSSATDFVRPGSFPYPITITIDRHGGTAKQKMVYCYGVENQRINATEKKLQIEDRGFGGSLVDPAPGIFNNTGGDGASALIGRSDHADADAGVDGGSGGCSCQWTNWVAQS